MGFGSGEVTGSSSALGQPLGLLPRLSRDSPGATVAPLFHMEGPSGNRSPRSEGVRLDVNCAQTGLWEGARSEGQWQRSALLGATRLPLAEADTSGQTLTSWVRTTSGHCPHL